MDVFSYFVIIIFLSCSIWDASSRIIPNKSVLDSGEPVAYLSINAMAFTNSKQRIVKRRLELNWFNLANSLHRVALYESNPQLDLNSVPKMVIDPSKNLDEFHTTDIQLRQFHGSELGFESRCVYDYWIRVETENGTSVTQSECLRMYPSWMYDHKSEIGGLKLQDLSLVETHDSGAYKEYEGPQDDNWGTLAVYAQEENLLQQLLWGVRALDIRIGYYPTLEEKFWLVHGIIKVHPLSEGILQVAEFLTNSRDIVIWHTQAVEQEWTDEAHQELISILTSSFSDWWVKPASLGWEKTLNQVWEDPDLAPNQGRIIFSSFLDSGLTDPSLFFDNRHYTWGNVNDPVDLKNYLDEAVKDADAKIYNFWTAGCQMTPNAADIITGKWKGLRDMADKVNRNVTKWWSTDYGYHVRVATSHDFFLSTDQIRVGIYKTLRVAQKLQRNTV